MHGVQATLQVVRRMGEEQGEMSEVSQSVDVDPLNLQGSLSRENEKRVVTNKGSRGLTKHGRRLIMYAATSMEEQFGAKNCAFATLTVPALSDEEMMLVCQNWAKLVKGINEWIGNQTEDGWKVKWIVGVTECQLKRSRRESRFVPHYHCVFPCKKAGTYTFSPRDLRKAWGRLLSRVIQRSLSSSEISSVENLALVKTSVSRYLSKYMTKGGQSRSSASGTTLPGEEWIKAWYSVTRRVRTLYRQSIRSLHNDACLFLADLIDRGVEIEGVKMGAIKVKKRDRAITVGYWILPKGLLPLPIAEYLLDVHHIVPNRGYVA